MSLVRSINYHSIILLIEGNSYQIQNNLYENIMNSGSYLGYYGYWTKLYTRRVELVRSVVFNSLSSLSLYTVLNRDMNFTPRLHVLTPVLRWHAIDARWERSCGYIYRQVYTRWWCLPCQVSSRAARHLSDLRFTQLVWRHFRVNIATSATRIVVHRPVFSRPTPGAISQQVPSQSSCDTQGVTLIVS